MPSVSRFAPSTTGQAHPGTLVSALLVWLDARSRGGRALLRLEDIDPDRSQQRWKAAMVEALQWLGLDWDGTIVQSERRSDHEAALDALAAAGRLYPCQCSRQSRRGGRRAPDGGWAYDNRCRDRKLPAGLWRNSRDPLRARIDDEPLVLHDESGLDLSQHPAVEMGDPVVRRRDGAIAYQLAVVVDDARDGITRVVRGRDIAPSTATQVMLHRALGLTVPAYRHHLLLLEQRGGQKLAKLHGSIELPLLRERYRGDELCGVLAGALGLGEGAPCRPADLLATFDWTKVRDRDLATAWRGELRFDDAT